MSVPDLGSGSSPFGPAAAKAKAAGAAGPTPFLFLSSEALRLQIQEVVDPRLLDLLLLDTRPSQVLDRWPRRLRRSQPE